MSKLANSCAGRADAKPGREEGEGCPLHFEDGFVVECNNIDERALARGQLASEA
jgi:hypothetical protein